MQERAGAVCRRPCDGAQRGWRITDLRGGDDLGARLALEYRRPELEWELGTEVAVDGTSRYYHAEFILSGPGVWEVRARVIDTGDSDHLPATSGAEIVDVHG